MKGKIKILLISPLLDLPTVTSNLATYDLIKYIDAKHNIDLDLLWGIGATRWFFNSYAKRKKYDLIAYLGHGEKDRLLGNHLFWSIINKKNVYRAKDMIIATMACFSSAELGKVAIKNGVKAYIGTRKEYYAFFPEKERNFLKDWRVITTTYFKELIDGKTAGDAFGKFLAIGKQYLKLYARNINYRNYDWYFSALKHNLEYTELLGDPNARLYENEKLD